MHIVYNTNYANNFQRRTNYLLSQCKCLLMLKLLIFIQLQLAEAVEYMYACNMAMLFFCAAA